MTPGKKTRSGGARPGAGRRPSTHRVELGELGHILAAWPGAVAIPAEINDLAAIVVKLAAADAASAHRPGVTVGFQSQAGLYPQAAVIRLLLTVYDNIGTGEVSSPSAPLAFDCFLNPADAHDLSLLRKLLGQTLLDLHFFDDGLHYQYTKRIPFGPVARADLAGLLECALTHNADLSALPDYPHARAQMMQEFPL